MFKTLDPKMLRRSQYLKEPDKFPPRHPEDAPGGIRRNISEGILYKLEGLQPTNLIPDKYNDKDYLRFSYKEESALADARWLVGGAGPSKLIFVHGEFDGRTGNPVKLCFYTLGNRCLIYDLRTQKVTSGTPPAARWIMEQHGHWLVGQDIKALLKRMVITSFFTIEVRDIARLVCKHPKNPFNIPKEANVDELGRWLMPLLWFDEFGGLISRQGFKALQRAFPQKHLTDWPWSRRPSGEQSFDIALNNWQASYLRNCGIADASTVLTFCLLELATEGVTVTINKRITNKIVIPSGSTWDKAATFILMLQLADATLTKEERKLLDHRALVNPPTEQAIRAAFQETFLWQKPTACREGDHPVEDRQQRLEKYKNRYRNAVDKKRSSGDEEMEIDIEPAAADWPKPGGRAKLSSVVAAVIDHNAQVDLRNTGARRRSPVRAPTPPRETRGHRHESDRSRSRRESRDRGREPRGTSRGRRGEKSKADSGEVKRRHQDRRRSPSGSYHSRGGTVYDRLGRRRSPAARRRTPPRHSSASRSSSTARAPSPLKYASAEAPTHSTTVVYPHRFQLTPAIEARCPLCGERRGEKHRKVEDCPHYKRISRTHGSNRANWGLRLCDYRACQEPHTHKVAACPWLHMKCGTCHVRDMLKGLYVKRATLPCRRCIAR